MRTTTKPCPGCGGSTPRQPDRVCIRCVTDITIGREERAIARTALGPLVLYRLREGEWPGYFVPAKQQKDLCSSMFRMAFECLTPSRDEWDPWSKDVIEIPEQSGQVHYFSTYSDNPLVMVGRSSQVAAINALDEAIRNAIAAVREEARQDGKNMLLQLARGEVTISQLNEEAIGRRELDEE